MGSPYLLSGARTRDMGEKIYLTYEQQVEKLRRDGLIVDDEKAAVARLKWEGYYNFAVGYNRLFKDDKKRYIRGVRFGHIEALYDFDKHLRGIVYEYTQGVECNLKALIADTFSRLYGVREREYLSEENFTSDPAERGNVRWLISTCRELLSDGKKEGTGGYRDYIAHNAKVYGHVPLWALIRAMSFGNASRFLKLMKPEDRGEIAREYRINGRTLCNMTELAVGFRNIAAHGERVYCARLPAVRLTENLPLFRRIQVPCFPDGKPRYGRCDFLSLMLVFKYLLPRNEFSAFLSRVEKEVDALKEKLPAFAMKRVYEQTGLSGAWRKLGAVSL